MEGEIGELGDTLHQDQSALTQLPPSYASPLPSSGAAKLFYPCLGLCLELTLCCLDFPTLHKVFPVRLNPWRGRDCPGIIAQNCPYRSDHLRRPVVSLQSSLWGMK